MTSPLFERQATGGVVARDGFEYQDAFLLQHIPQLLAQGAFCQAVSELLGDVELRYFRPGGGTFCVLYEAKRHQLTKADFWAEVAHFRELHEKAPDEYVQFVLVCGDFNGDFEPLLRKLERYRGPAGALNADSNIRVSAEADIEAAITSFGQTTDIARFVLERVAFVKYSDANVAGGFASLLAMHLPELSEIRGGETTAFMKRCKELVDTSVKGVISRKAIEAALLDCATSVASEWLATPSRLDLSAQTQFELGPLALDLAAFNGPARGSLGRAAWAELQQRLLEVGDFLQASRARRGVCVSAKQRMSLACLVGYCLSATRGLTLALEHNCQVFDTAVHERSAGPFFTVKEDAPSAQGLDGVASICFPYDGNEDVLASAKDIGLGDASKLALASALPVTGIETLNTAVHEAKAALVAFRTRHQLRRMHLFIKAPSVFAIALGHRLNGVGGIQLYDWDQARYIPTVQLG